MNNKVAVVILNWNGLQYLEKFLSSVVQYTKEATVFVADNNSTDTSVAYVKANFPSLELICLERNEGFCKGYNLALAQLDYEYAVLLNSDVEVTDNWLAPMIELMDSNAQIAACQPKIKDYHHRSSFEYAGAAGGYLDKYGYPFCRGRIFDTLETDKGQYDDTREISWATGACMVVRLAVYKQLGGLDDDFFAHMEEIDLCWRMKNSGYSIYYCGQSEVFHVGGGTLNKLNPRKTYLNFRNGLSLLYKNLPSGVLMQRLLIRLVLDGIAGVKFFLSGQFKHTWAIVRAHFAFYGRLPKLRSYRKAHAATLGHVAKGHLYNKSVIWKYFVEGKKKFSEIV